MSIELRLLACCAFRELHSISTHRTPDAVVGNIGRQIYNVKNCYGEIQLDNFRYFLFTAVKRADTKPYGEQLATYIQKHALGTVIETGEHINPNTGNVVKAWIWTVDHDAMRKHLKRPLPLPVASPVQPEPLPTVDFYNNHMGAGEDGA